MLDDPTSSVQGSQSGAAAVDPRRRPCCYRGEPRPAIPDPNSTHHRVALGPLLLPHPIPLAAGEPSRRNLPFPVRPFFNLRPGDSL